MPDSGNTIGRTSSTPPPATLDGANLRDASKEGVGASGTTPQAPPRRSLFRLALKSALERLPFVKFSRNITADLEPGTAAHRTAGLLQNFSKPNVSADRLSGALLATLPRDLDYIGTGKDSEGKKLNNNLRSNLEEQIGKLSDQQLYRLNKRANSSRMQGVVAGLKEQAEAEADPYKKKVLRKTAQCLEDTASIAARKLNERGYQTPAPKSGPASAPTNAAQKELRVFTRNVDAAVAKMSSSYTLGTTGVLELKEAKPRYKQINDIANTLNTDKDTPQWRNGYSSKTWLPHEACFTDKPIPWQTVEDCHREQADDPIHIQDKEGKDVRPLQLRDRKEDGKVTHEAKWGVASNLYEQLAERFGDEPGLLYKIASVTSQHSATDILTLFTHPDNHNRPNVLPDHYQHLNSRDRNEEPWPTANQDSLTKKYTLSDDDKNVYVDIDMKSAGHRWFTREGVCDMMDPETSSLKGRSRVVIPKDLEQPPHIELGSLSGEVNVQAALMD